VLRRWPSVRCDGHEQTASGEVGRRDPHPVGHEAAVRKVHMGAPGNQFWRPHVSKRVMQINALLTVTKEAVEAARENLVIEPR
jgi:hypothetical protein